MLKSSPSSRAFLAANNDLDPERVRLGVEAGLDWTPAPAVVARATGFWIDVSDAILDVVMGVAGSVPENIEPCGRILPRGVCQQRQNVELLRSKGFEADVDVRPGGPWRFWAAYTYTDSRIVESAIDPTIEGNWVRRIPLHQATARASYDSAKLFAATIQLRYQGARWEDNVNELVIDDAWIADLRLSRPFAGIEAFVEVENLLDEEVQVGRNEEFGEIGAPRTFSAGIVWRHRGGER
jgi:outer membrane receptor protein involved in Fe transport